MSRTFIATISAAAIALTAFGAAPSFAQERNYKLERTIAAILGAAVVGKILHDKNTRDRGDRHVQPVQPDRSPAVTWESHRPDRIKPRPLPKRVDRRLLPRQCFRSFQTHRGTYRGFGQRCLSNNFRHAHRLPQHCLTRLRTDRGPRRVFEARCLRNAGYRLARG